MPKPFALTGPTFGASAACVRLLRRLPEWFGIEATLAQYETEIDALPTFQAWGALQTLLGFLALKQHTPYAAEIYVMGVLPEVHRRGVGRALVGAAEAWLREQAVEYLQVKTLGPSREDPDYARTRAFYAALDFRPLEELKQLWDANNPCLILVKRL